MFPLLETIAIKFGASPASYMVSKILNQIEADKNRLLEAELLAALRERGQGNLLAEMKKRNAHNSFVFNMNRYQRCAFEGAANENVRLLARLLVGLQLESEGHDFPSWCSRIGDLSRSELKDLATLAISHRQNDRPLESSSSFLAMQNMKESEKRRFIASLFAITRTGLTIPVSSFGMLVVELSDLYFEMLRVTNLADLSSCFDYEVNEPAT